MIEEVEMGQGRNIKAVGKGWVVRALYRALIGLRYYQQDLETGMETPFW